FRLGLRLFSNTFFDWLCFRLRLIFYRLRLAYWCFYRFRLGFGFYLRSLIVLFLFPASFFDCLCLLPRLAFLFFYLFCLVFLFYFVASVLYRLSAVSHRPLRLALLPRYARFQVLLSFPARLLFPPVQARVAAVQQHLLRLALLPAQAQLLLPAQDRLQARFR